VSIPNWFELLVLALASWRTWKLLAEDDILNRPRRYVTGLNSTWKAGDPTPKEYRYGLAEFITCPYCLGFYVALGWWGLWQAWPHGALVAASLAALSALVPLVDRLSGD
jgi:hypothetical protein